MTNDLYNQLINRETKLSLIGLGCVGLPIAVAFARKVDVIGFDLNSEKIALYRQGSDPTREEGDDVIRQTAVDFTSDATRLSDARFHIIAVPTPVNPRTTRPTWSRRKAHRVCSDATSCQARSRSSSPQCIQA